MHPEALRTSKPEIISEFRITGGREGHRPYRAVDSGCRCFMAYANPCRSNYKLPSWDYHFYPLLL